MKIYVGNFTITLTEDQLQDVFATFGKVKSTSIVRDKFSGVSRGFGFVEMECENEAKIAIKALSLRWFHGKTLIVNEALNW